MTNLSDYYGYIYITTNLVNGKQYIGKHKGQYDSSYLGSGKLIKRSINKYGKDLFDNHVICFCLSNEELFNTEAFYIDLLDCSNSENYYNLVPGGPNPIMFGDKNPMRKLKGENHPLKGYKHTKKARKNMSNRQLGVKNHNFKGYYITPLGKYTTSHDAFKDMNELSASIIRKWCKNCDKIISNHSYSLSKYLNRLGSREEIVGKTYKDIGFYFLWKSSS